MRLFLCIVSLLCVIATTGCVATEQKSGGMRQSISTAALEQRVQRLEHRFRELQKKVVSESREQDAIKKNLAVLLEAEKEKESLPGPKQIQTALKRAGFYTGPIDGKVGRKTQQAIMEFQKKHGLRVDGVVGSSTWDMLQEYEKK